MNFDETNTTLFCKGLFEWWNKQNTFFKGPNRIKIDHNADSVLGHRANDNLDSTCLKEEIYDDSEKENLLIGAVVIVEEEEEGGNEEEKEEGEEEEEKEGEEEED
ncbi:hypothetical protein HZH68_016098 [Vespula germanica]|uniref:Uncharacterized protein n=1 Tax=Vespula germanica TaxID=30212 RepID=A0A834J3A7_VESGE|nr:hypothetical protein HZH68_016098 [Vespula germanica]